MCKFRSGIAFKHVSILCTKTFNIERHMFCLHRGTKEFRLRQQTSNNLRRSHIFDSVQDKNSILLIDMFQPSLKFSDLGLLRPNMQ